MVNRYDQPAQAEFMNTYVPIPFEQLYNLGKAAGERIDKAMTTFRTARDNWAKFQSESAKDNDNWDKVTMRDTGIRDLINQMSSNPDLIKDSRYQMALTGAINNVDTAAMRNLQQSAKNFEIRKENVAKLIAQNRYNEAWHLMNVTNWDTLNPNQGVFTDVNPTPYQTSAEMVKPYLDDMKDTFLGNKGGYNWYGVTEEQARKQVDEYLSDILATPQAEEYFKQYRKLGMTEEEAYNKIKTNLLNAADKFARKKGEADPYALEELRFQNAIRKKGLEDKQDKVPDLYDQQFATVDLNLKDKWNKNPFYKNSAYNQVKSDIINELNAYKQAYEKGDISEDAFFAFAQDAEKQLKAAEEENMYAVNRNFFESRAGAESATRGVGENVNKLRTYTKGIDDLIAQNNTDLAPSLVRGLSIKQYGNEQLVNFGDTKVLGYNVPTNQGYILDFERGRKLMGVKPNGTQIVVKDDNNHEINFDQIFSSKRFGNGVWLPDNQGTTETINGSPALGIHGNLLISKTALQSELGEKGYESLKKQLKARYGDSVVIAEKSLSLKDFTNSNTPETTLNDEYLQFNVTKYISNYGMNRMEYNQVGQGTWAGNTAVKDRYVSDYNQSYFDNAKKIVE